MARLEACGYQATYWKLDATAFGVPQERTRIFVVGSRSGLLPAHPECDFLRVVCHHHPRLTAGQ